MGFLTCCSPCRGHSAQLHGDCQLVVKNMWTMWLNTLGVHLMEGKWQEGPTEWESPSWKKCLWDGFGATVVNSCNMSSVILQQKGSTACTWTEGIRWNKGSILCSQSADGCWRTVSPSSTASQHETWRSYRALRERLTEWLRCWEMSYMAQRTLFISSLEVGEEILLLILRTCSWRGVLRVKSLLTLQNRA